MKPDIISVGDEDDSDVEHDAVEPVTVTDVEDDYSDSGSPPEEVQRIALLQKKVAQLESILRDYRMKEQSKENMIETPNVVYTPSMVPIEHYPLVDHNHNHNHDDDDDDDDNPKGNIV